MTRNAMYKGTQEEFLDFIIQLKAENTELEIKFCVDNTEIADDCAWTAHKINYVKVSPFWQLNAEYIETDKDAILECMAYEILKDFEFSEERIKALAEMRYEEEIKYAICVFTCAA